MLLYLRLAFLIGAIGKSHRSTLARLMISKTLSGFITHDPLLRFCMVYHGPEDKSEC
jgi:hypothetical protein